MMTEYGAFDILPSHVQDTWLSERATDNLEAALLRDEVKPDGLTGWRTKVGDVEVEIVQMAWNLCGPVPTWKRVPRALGVG